MEPDLGEWCPSNRGSYAIVFQDNGSRGMQGCSGAANQAIGLKKTGL